MSEIDQALRAHFERLLSACGADGRPLTQQAMADRLNREHVPSLSGQPWSKYSVRRILRKLEQPPAAAGSTSRQLSDDEIRERVKNGYYDTPEERFIAVPRTPPEPQQGKAAKPAGGQKPKKGKGKKKKDKKAKGKKKS